jgi:sugar/nucleoside kinase (ribokinase family)
VIAVVGSPIGRRSGASIVAAGLPVAIARAAAARGGAVQLIGKVGEGPDGDAMLLSLAADGVGHVALLRDAAPAKIEPVPAATELGDRPLDVLAGLDGSAPEDGSRPDDASAGPDLDAEDLELALRYLPDYDVVVIARPLGSAAVSAVSDAARWAGAHVVLVGTADPSLPEGSTVLEPPAEDAEGAFATLVGRYAAALDTGASPADAFAAASAAVGWTPVGAD